jgi:putative FmdB family regulatory protein
MPIYEYRCAKGHTFEVMRSISADPLTKCETCAAPVERVFHPIAVHFKGSGFYNTDYGTKKRSREAKEYKESNKSEKSEKSKDGGAKDGASSASSSNSNSNSDSGSSKSQSGSSSSKSDSGASKAPTKSSS